MEYEQSPKESISNQLIMPMSTTSSYTYSDVGLFKAYALTHAMSYNTKFPSYASGGGDCANFGSQCTWYGLGGSTDINSINNKLSPMVDRGASDPDSWYQSGTMYDTPTNWSWTGSLDYKDYLTTYPSSGEGLYGFSYSGYKYAEEGDRIHWDSDGNGTFDHTMVVVRVAGTYGSRTNNDIWVCGHTADVNYMILSDFSSSPESRYITLKLEYLREN